MKISEKVFANLINNNSFKADVLSLSKISPAKLDESLNIFLESKHRESYHLNINEYSKRLELSDEIGHDIWHMIDYLGYNIVTKHETNEIIEALNEVSGKKLNAKKFIDRLKDEKTQSKLKELDLIESEIGLINPHYENMVFNIEERKVLKDNKVIRNLPVVTLKFVTSDKDSGKEAIELLEEDLDHLIEGFKDIKNKIKIIKGQSK